METKTTIKGPHKIKLRETRDGCQPCERTPRVDVLLNGEKVGQLYFNMTGYCGTLPLPNGRLLGMPETSISVYRRTNKQTGNPGNKD